MLPQLLISLKLEQFSHGNDKLFNNIGTWLLTTLVGWVMQKDLKLSLMAEEMPPCSESTEKKSNCRIKKLDN